MSKVCGLICNPCSGSSKATSNKRYTEELASSIAEWAEKSAETAQLTEQESETDVDVFTQSLIDKADLLFRHIDKQNQGFISDVDIQNWTEEVERHGGKVSAVRKAVSKWQIPDRDTITKDMFIDFFVSMMQKKVSADDNEKSHVTPTPETAEALESAKSRMVTLVKDFNGANGEGTQELVTRIEALGTSNGGYNSNEIKNVQRDINRYSDRLIEKDAVTATTVRKTARINCAVQGLMSAYDDAAKTVACAGVHAVTGWHWLMEDVSMEERKKQALTVLRTTATRVTDQTKCVTNEASDTFMMVAEDIKNLMLNPCKVTTTN